MDPADVRRPAVAGQFYPGEAGELEREVARHIGDAAGARPRIAVMAPHAGYVYSGGVAGKVFAATRVPERVVVLAPNHTGRGTSRAAWARGALAIPGGSLPVDEELTGRLVDEGVLDDDREAHRREHALEVELPFLRARNPRVRVTPVVLGPLSLADCLAIGEALARHAPPDALVVASSDMNHYLPDDLTRVRDRLAIEPLLALDPERLHRTVEREDLSMCGYIPATVMLAYARARGARSAELVGYATSGDAFGDRSRVVGYAGVVVS